MWLAEQACECFGINPRSAIRTLSPCGSQEGRLGRERCGGQLASPPGWLRWGRQAGRAQINLHRVSQIECKFPDWAETSANSSELACSTGLSLFVTPCASIPSFWTSLPRLTRCEHGVLQDAPIAFSLSRSTRLPFSGFVGGDGAARRQCPCSGRVWPRGAGMQARGCAASPGPCRGRRRLLRAGNPIHCLSPETRQICWPYRHNANHIIPHRFLQRLWAWGTCG